MPKEKCMPVTSILLSQCLKPEWIILLSSSGWLTRGYGRCVFSMSPMLIANTAVPTHIHMLCKYKPWYRTATNRSMEKHSWGFILLPLPWSTSVHIPNLLKLPCFCSGSYSFFPACMPAFVNVDNHHFFCTVSFAISRFPLHQSSPTR